CLFCRFSFPPLARRSIHPGRLAAILSYLAGAGRQLRAPLIVGLFVLISALAVVLGDNHSVRRIDATKTAGGAAHTKRMPLEEAVTMWMQENICLDAPATCPRPIMIASA